MKTTSHVGQFPFARMLNREKRRRKILGRALTTGSATLRITRLISRMFSLGIGLKISDWGVQLAGVVHVAFTLLSNVGSKTPTRRSSFIGRPGSANGS